MCLHPVLHVAWASLSSTAFYKFWLTLKLVPWYCNNIYPDSILFEVRNVVTSLLGLVIVSHLSPRGLGRFSGRVVCGLLNRRGLENLAGERTVVATSTAGGRGREVRDAEGADEWGREAEREHSREEKRRRLIGPIEQ